MIASVRAEGDSRIRRGAVGDGLSAATDCLR